jgi:hypothetical protein
MNPATPHPRQAPPRAPESGFPARAWTILDSQPLRPQLAVIVEMLGSIDSLTTEGQRFTMRKVADFLRRRSASLTQAPGWPPATLARSLEHITREADRQVPHPRAFRRRAGVVLRLMAEALGEAPLRRTHHA